MAVRRAGPIGPSATGTEANLESLDTRRCGGNAFRSALAFGFMAQCVER